MSNKYQVYDRPTKNIKIEQRLLDPNKESRTGKKLSKERFSNRTGIKQIPQYIVIHEVSLGTGFSPSTYDMDRYENLLYDYAEKELGIGYHYCCGDDRVVQFIPDDEITLHVGNDFGNYNSIGIERLINKSTDRLYSLHNQAKLTATLMLKWNIPIENIKTHKHMQIEFTTQDKKTQIEKVNYEIERNKAIEKANKLGQPFDEEKFNEERYRWEWKPKNCPARMLAGMYGGFEQFRNEVLRCLQNGWLFFDILDIEILNKYKKIVEIDGNVYHNLFPDTIVFEQHNIHNVDGINKKIK